MKQRFLFFTIAALTLTLTACHQGSEVGPQPTTQSGHHLRVGVDSSATATSASNGSDRTKGPWWPYSDAQIKAMFDHMDLDHSGQLSVTEMEATFAQNKVKSLIAAELIKTFDRNSSGMMEFYEFQYLMAEISKNSDWRKIEKQS